MNGLAAGDKAGGTLGKRRQRRHENCTSPFALPRAVSHSPSRARLSTVTAVFSGNAKIVRPSHRDLSVTHEPVNAPTFAPPPVGFPSSLYIPASLDRGGPAAAASCHSAANGRGAESSEQRSASAGQYSLSLTGVRRSLRRAMGNGATPGSGGPVEDLLRAMDDEIVTWLDTLVFRSSQQAAASAGPRVIDDTPVELGGEGVTEPALSEISRSPTTLVWSLPGAYDRWLAHVIARYYGLLSFSRDERIMPPSGDTTATPTTTRRLTHLVRVHAARPNTASATAAFETPPTSELSAADTDGLSSVDALSDVASSAAEMDPSSASSSDDEPDDAASLAHEDAGDDADATLNDGEGEGDITLDASEALAALSIEHADTDIDADADDEIGSLASSLASLPPPSTLRERARRRQKGGARRRRPRSASSSPSRSPARFEEPQAKAKKQFQQGVRPAQSFMTFLYGASS